MAPNAAAIAALPNVLNKTAAEWENPMWQIELMLFPNAIHNGPPLPSELWVSLFFFLLWAGLRKLSFRYLLVPSVKWLGAADDGVHDYKCAVLLWNGGFHIWSALWLYWWLPFHRWYWDTEWLWENIMYMAKAIPMELEFKTFYMLQLGYHTQSLVWHALEERRPDFLTMVVHHVVTMLLIIGSWLRGYVRIGMLVLFVHDASDIFVCACKATHMCGMKKASHVLFVFMVVTWFYFRLYLYPTWVIWSVSTYPDPGKFGTLWWVFTGLMCILLVLHIWWFHLFMKMAWGIFKYKEGKDLTETKEARESAQRDQELREIDPQVAAEDGRSSFAAAKGTEQRRRLDVP
eukprot:TRINITY_DN5900_c0_g1_i1.p1 TRINITY_DN5900_c0_g1~~TRINITY_DN5900_c0_g1_i1.p1  ORF type:complete len:376 (+),score=130.50 TRINITY_DN5900_c0_g1_i1:91-1128(+)